MSEKEKFVGTGVAMVTPFKNDGAIDFAVLESHTDELIKHGIDYLVVLGTTAETPTLSKEEKIEIINVVKKTAGDRVPVIVGAGGNNTAGVIEWIREIGSVGIDAYLSVAPYYSKPSQTGMIQHFSAIAASSDLPLMIYNVPGRTSSNIEAATMLQLAHDLGDKIVAVKEASGNFQQIMEIQKDKPEDFLVISGDDAIALPMISLGCSGVVSVIGNALPGLTSQMINDGLSGNYDAAREKHYQMLPMISAIFNEGNPTGVKALMEIRGYGENNLRLPLITATSALYEEIRKLNSLL
jgi:4-hydroxy-tetrahydrodipicolinate synthase